MNITKITENLFERCKAEGLINPINGEGSPTRAMVEEELNHVHDSAEVDDLSVLVRILIVKVRKHEPDSVLAKVALDYLRTIGQSGSILRGKNPPTPATPEPTP